jgi:serine/threonine protein kinase
MPLFQDIADRDLRALLRELVQYDEQRRPAAAEALDHVYFDATWASSDDDSSDQDDAHDLRG